jgi:hypothetical protein
MMKFLHTSCAEEVSKLGGNPQFVCGHVKKRVHLSSVPGTVTEWREWMSKNTAPMDDVEPDMSLNTEWMFAMLLWWTWETPVFCNL